MRAETEVRRSRRCRSSSIGSVPGYELVSISRLMGRTRDDVMPPVSADKKVTAVVNRQTFRLMYAVSKILYLLFLAGTVLGIARLVFIAAAAVIDNVGGEQQRLHRDSCRTWR